MTSSSLHAATLWTLIAFILTACSTPKPVSDKAGKFEISDIPPRTYNLAAWHERYNVTKMDSGRPMYDNPHVIKKQVEVKPGGTVEMNFEFPSK